MTTQTEIPPSPSADGECPSCQAPIKGNGSFCHRCGAPRPAPSVSPPAFARRPVPFAPPRPVAVEKIHRRSVFEILLDPRTIHWLLGSGGVLLVAGVIVWLASLGLFENPLVVAAFLGAGTLCLMGAGWGTLLRTRFHTAGRAITLLSCLVMPLNLWFYHRNALMTFEGQLWIAALACCALYAASARVLRDSLFVHVLMGGIAMTGLLMLGSAGRFAEIASPSAMLVALGLLAIHIERAFSPEPGEFSRDNFGRAFFRSGHALLLGGLALLLGAQLTGFAHDYLLGSMFDIPQPAVCSVPALRLLAVGIVGAGIYGYLYSRFVAKKSRFFGLATVLGMLWLEVLVLDLLHVSFTGPSVAIVLSLTALLGNVMRRVIRDEESVLRSAGTVGAVMCWISALTATSLIVRSTFNPIHNELPYEMSWLLVIAAAVAALSGRASAWLCRNDRRTVPQLYVVAYALSSLAALSATLSLAGVAVSGVHFAALLAFPVLLQLNARRLRDTTTGDALTTAGDLSSAAIVLGAIAFFIGLIEPLETVTHAAPSLLTTALFFVSAATYFAIARITTGRTRDSYLGSACGLFALWQVFRFFEITPLSASLLFSTIGTSLLGLHRLLKTNEKPRAALYACGNAVVSIATTAAMLYVCTRLLVGGFGYELPLKSLGLIATSLLASWCVGKTAFRRWYLFTAVAHGVLLAIAMQQLSLLTFWQKAEILSIVVGLLMLIGAHIGWYREQNDVSEGVGQSLFAGSFFLTAPLLIATFANRFTGQISTIDELALLVASVSLFVLGVTCRVRSTTLAGGVALSLHLLVLIGCALSGMKDQLGMGVLLAGGGTAIFLLGVTLSIYRERLIALPEKVRNRDGVFKVLAWR